MLGRFSEWLRRKALQVLADLLIGGYYHATCYNADGSVAWKDVAKNGVTNAGLNDIIGVYLASVTQKTAWFIGLIDNAAFSSLNVADTMATHTGWAESSAYSESVRQTWTPGSVAGQSVTNPTPATFTANASVTLYGLFLVSNSTKGNTAGVLWATGGFQSGTQSLTTGQTLKVTYSLSAAGA